MQSATRSPQGHVPEGPGPLNPWVRQVTGHDISYHMQHGQDALMANFGDVERMVNENSTMICAAGLVLGTLVDRRFYLLPLAVGGLKLWRTMQDQQ